MKNVKLLDLPKEKNHLLKMLRTTLVCHLTFITLYCPVLLLIIFIDLLKCLIKPIARINLSLKFYYMQRIFSNPGLAQTIKVYSPMRPKYSTKETSANLNDSIK